MCCGLVAGLRHVWKESQPAYSAQSVKPARLAHSFLVEIHDGSSFASWEDGQGPALMGKVRECEDWRFSYSSRGPFACPSIYHHEPSKQAPQAPGRTRPVRFERNRPALKSPITARSTPNTNDLAVVSASETARRLKRCCSIPYLPGPNENLITLVEWGQLEECVFMYSWPVQHLPNRRVSLICVRLTTSKLCRVWMNSRPTEEQKCVSSGKRGTAYTNRLGLASMLCCFQLLVPTPNSTDSTRPSPPPPMETSKRLVGHRGAKRQDEGRETQLNLP
jgi:hypothetical protein